MSVDTDQPAPETARGVDVTDLPVLTRRASTPGVNPHRAALHALAGPPATAPQPVDSAHPSPHPHPARPVVVPEEPEPATGGGPDWRFVAGLRRRVSEELQRRIDQAVDAAARASSADPRDRGLFTLAAQQEQELGRQVITEVVDAADVDSTNSGKGAFTLAHRDYLHRTLFDEIFGLGRLQPLLDDPTVLNIVMASGYDRIFVYRANGAIDPVDPIADSDEDLIDFLTRLASKGQGGNARPFSPAVPVLHLRLPDGSRLAAVSWVTASGRPSVLIRCHRLLRSTLEDLIDRGTLTPLAASFLAAAVKAKKNIVIGGDQGAGKTTLMRALCGQIDPWESIVTIETNAELFLHDFTEQHPIVHALEERPGMGEIGADGQQAGAYSLARGLVDSQRLQGDRTIVGEVRSYEAWSMIKAMESGGGGLCTTHALNASLIIPKLVTCAMEAGSHVSAELATLKLANVIDIVVQLGVKRIPKPGGGSVLEHWLDEIIAITPGEATSGLEMTTIFKTTPGGRVAHPVTLPDHLRDLRDYGFDTAAFTLDRIGDSA